MITKIVTAIGYRELSFTRGIIDTFSFSERIKGDESPLECAKRRMNELFPSTSNFLTHVTLRIEDEDENCRSRLIEKRDILFESI